MISHADDTTGPAKWPALRAEALHLAQQASALLAEGNYARAVWRLVDAAGIATRVSGYDPEGAAWSGETRLIGAHDPTGRGFRVTGGGDVK